MLVLASNGPLLPGTRKACSWLGRPAFQTGQQACGEHYSADQQENCQWKEKFSFSQQEKQKNPRAFQRAADGNRWKCLLRSRKASAGGMAPTWGDTPEAYGDSVPQRSSSDPSPEILSQTQHLLMPSIFLLF